MFDMAIFRVAGFEFGVAFVVKTKRAYDLLKVNGARYGLKIDIISEADDGDILCAVVDSDDEHTTKDANSFFKTLKRNEMDWVKDREVIDDQPVLIFYSREVLS